MNYVLGAEIKGLVVRIYSGSRWRTTMSIDADFPSAPFIRFPRLDTNWVSTLDSGNAHVASWDIAPETMPDFDLSEYCELWVEDEVWAAGEVKISGPPNL